jgi:hypothetical protein
VRTANHPVAGNERRESNQYAKVVTNKHMVIAMNSSAKIVNHAGSLMPSIATQICVALLRWSKPQTIAAAAITRSGVSCKRVPKLEFGDPGELEFPRRSIATL